jgi:hypothetical protein
LFYLKEIAALYISPDLISGCCQNPAWDY